MDDKTIKEICDVVTAEVMKQIRKNLSAMKPDIIEQIKNSVKKTAIQETQRITDSKYNKMDNRISQLENKNNAEKSDYQSNIPALEKRIAQLELRGNNSDNNEYRSTIRTLENRIEQLETTIAKLTAKPTTPHYPKAERITAKAVDGINTLSLSQINEILSFPELSIEDDGWIYYYRIIKPGTLGYGEIYKVRTDGSDNQKIFNGKAHGLYTSQFKLRGDFLHFEDSDGQKRAIKVK
ncbi:hypothetical protein [Ruminococcus sp.]|uniref:hypothetical protein n=1 Tax=Ruminococcus sp. TaxID=41978 RepID=UPI0025D7A826|nr:hypothetical protein [Ruminococcus sp.]MBR1432094.1 hypothetical protein [Ruminococcus sp.]